MVLVPGLLCNFGWEVTIKIHYSTVSGGGHSKLNPFIFNHIIIIVRIEGISFCSMFFLLAAGNLNICLHEVRYLLLQPNTDWDLKFCFLYVPFAFAFVFCFAFFLFFLHCFCICFAFFCIFFAFFLLFFAFWFAFFLGLLFCFTFFSHFFTNKLIFKFIGFCLSG